MDDAVEVAAVMKVLRPLQEDGNETLPFQAVKTSTGNSWYSSGMQAFLRAVASGRQSFLPPLLHLRRMNPFCDDVADARPALFPNEIMEHRARNSIIGVMACGWGGTNAYVQVWTESETGRRMNEGKTQLNLSYWPGGGGAMDLSLEPSACYTIVGSWSGWSRLEVMESEGDGKYGFTVTIGANRWEMFQIMLDGDISKVLHPNMDKAPKGTAAYGPDDEMGLESAWMIDGRTAVSARESGTVIDKESLMMNAAEAVVPGTRFRVKLHEVGRWRYVSWERLPKISRHDDHLAAEDMKSLIRGTYYLNFGGDLKKMVADSKDDSIHTATVILTRNGLNGGAFHILRNCDPCQTFYPEMRSAPSGDTEVLGPDEGLSAGFWFLDGLVGDVFEVTFERRLGDSGVDLARKVSWTQTQARDFREEAYSRR